jgi:hypothetical protein
VSRTEHPPWLAAQAEAAERHRRRAAAARLVDEIVAVAFWSEDEFRKALTIFEGLYEQLCPTPPEPGHRRQPGWLLRLTGWRIPGWLR